MTTNASQGSNILDVLKKKMRQTKEEMEKYKEDCDDMQRKLQVEVMRREEVSPSFIHSFIHSFFIHLVTLMPCKKMGFAKRVKMAENRRGNTMQ